MGGSRLDRKINEYELGIERTNEKTEEKREQLKLEFYNYDKMLREIKKEWRKRPVKVQHKEFWENKVKALISLMDGVRGETVEYDKQLAWRMNERLKQRKIEFSVTKEEIRKESTRDDSKEELER